MEYFIIILQKMNLEIIIRDNYEFMGQKRKYVEKIGVKVENILQEEESLCS